MFVNSRVDKQTLNNHRLSQPLSLRASTHRVSLVSLVQTNKHLEYLLRSSRNRNYEAILRIINDCLQGRVEGLAFLFAGTDECLEDPRRGFYSYEALATRLAPNRYADNGQQDYASPVIKLGNLSPEDCFVLLANIRNVHCGGESAEQLIPDDGIVAYLQACSARMGAAYFQTPRDTVKDFVNLLNMLQQDSSRSWQDHVQRRSPPPEQPQARQDGKPSAASGSDDLSEFRL